jgi:hypothetical protein
MVEPALENRIGFLPPNSPGVAMISVETFNDTSCHDKGCDDIKIAACKSVSGAVKEIVYCQMDRCFYVTVDGREKLRSDIPDTAYKFFSSPTPG